MLMLVRGNSRFPHPTHPSTADERGIRPAQAFLDSVGEDFKEVTEGRAVYRFEAGYAGAVEELGTNFAAASEAVLEAPTAEAPARTVSEAALSAPSRGTLLNRIAGELSSVTAIIAATASAKVPSAQGAGSTAPPRNQLEQVLVDIWSGLLQVKALGIHENFFALGGHSLLAVQVIARVRRSIGVELPLRAMFEAQTIAEFGKLIEEERRTHTQKGVSALRRVPGDGNIPPSLAQQRSWFIDQLELGSPLREGLEEAPEPLVAELQIGNGGTPPVFAVVEPGPNSLGYVMLARHMGAEQAFYKLQAQSKRLRGRPMTLDEMRSFAQQYIAGMRVVQPQGPYYIVAMCGGCQIAEQMILQLEAQGQQVGLFAVFDTWVMENIHRRWRWRLFWYQQRLRWLRRATFAERLDWATHAVENRIRIWSGKAEAYQPWAEAYWPKSFTPQRFRAPIVLFKRPKQPYYYIDDPLLGWGARTEGGVEAHPLNADHHEVLREPHVQKVSQVLKERLSATLGHEAEPLTRSAADG